MGLKVITVFIVIFFLGNTSGFSQVSLKHLKCEYLINPIGIDTKKPRFSWQIETNDPGYLMQAYHIKVYNNSSKEATENKIVWESEIINSSTLPAVYKGPDLQPFTPYSWQIRVQDINNIWSGWSPIAFFETGMIDQNNWVGHWITDTSDYNLKPAPYFRREFQTPKKIKSARAYIAAAGLYELSINGERIGNHRLDPMYTRFDRRNLYVSYDVTKNLQQGNNAIGVLLGNGWYNHQSKAVWYFDKAPWRARPKFCLDLRITYEDGSSEIISTDHKWQTSLSPVIFNSIYTAEHYDARLEQTGWNTANFNSAEWRDAMATNAPSQNITSQMMHPIRNLDEIKAIDFKKTGDRTWLFNFGRNLAGVTRLNVSGTEGTIIRLKHVERLDKEGNADMSNLDVHYRPTDDSDPFQTDIFILSGKGEETFMPKFNYKGFQYVELTADQPLELSQENLTAIFMHSDVPATGEIQSSNTTLNKLWEAANASYLSNLYGYPTDCPQREKNGWTGDAHIAIETGLYNFDGITIYEKWLADHRDEQQANGVLPAIIPSNGWGYTWANGPDWTSTIAIIPWNIYLFYGDSRLLELCYENIKRYVDHLDKISPSGLTDWGLGDWVPVKSVTPKEYTSSTYFYVDALILSKTAGILGRKTDRKKYHALAQKIKTAINDKYLDREKGMYGSGLQTELSVALYWGLVPDELIEKVAKNLAKKVVDDNKHIDVGLLGSKTILNALSENGYSDLAWEVASQETYPSWGWWIVNGATTFYENWIPDAENDISMNHIMFGEINAWYYKALGGIFPDEKQTGFKNVILKPHFVSNLDQFEAKHESPYGEIISSWKRKDENIEYFVRIPANSTATLYLESNPLNIELKSPGDKKLIKTRVRNKRETVYSLVAGSYQFIIK